MKKGCMASRCSCASPLALARSLTSRELPLQVEEVPAQDLNRHASESPRVRLHGLVLSRVRVRVEGDTEGSLLGSVFVDGLLHALHADGWAVGRCQVVQVNGLAAEGDEGRAGGKHVEVLLEARVGLSGVPPGVVRLPSVRPHGEVLRVLGLHVFRGAGGWGGGHNTITAEVGREGRKGKGGGGCA